MSGSSELSFEAVRDFIILNGGKVRNHDLVKHFKKFLTKPQNRDDARNYFKEIVNEVAIIRTEGDEKYLILKRKFRPPGLEECFSPTSSSTSAPTVRMSTEPSFPRGGVSPRQPPPYRAPPPPTTPTRSNPSSPVSTSPATTPTNAPCDVPQQPPPVPLRKKSISDKSKKEHHAEPPPQAKHIAHEASDPEPDGERKISVKERMQKFNRMASESDLPKVPMNITKKKLDKEDDDSSSMTSIDPKTREWLVHAAKGEYQVLAKLAAECPRLVRTKDPTTGTALHWAAKHGNENLVKLIAGTYKLDPNVRTNGGYTPLHLAMQYEHEDIFDLLVQVYAADQNLRDWSGRKPRQYRANSDTSVSADTFRRLVAGNSCRSGIMSVESGFPRGAATPRPVHGTPPTDVMPTKLFAGAPTATSAQHEEVSSRSFSMSFPPCIRWCLSAREIKARKKYVEKESGFLRIGSLNVRVRKTTEAFSNYFLGQNSDKLHKSWGSADNVHDGDKKLMQPPKSVPIKKRKSKREFDYAASRSTPTTPTQHRSSAISIGSIEQQDSDSDTAAGFGANWQS